MAVTLIDTNFVDSSVHNLPSRGIQHTVVAPSLSRRFIVEQNSNQVQQSHEPWNKGKLVGQKRPFKLREIWAIRVWLQTEHRIRELALFDLGLDSKLRACDLVKLKVRDICHGDRVAARANVMQQKTTLREYVTEKIWNRFFGQIWTDPDDWRGVYPG
jgi:hypothetical protein